MMNDFDKLKCKFNGQTIVAEVSASGLPEDRAKGVVDGFMGISGEDLQEIFEPVIKEIIRLIQEQIDKVNEEGMRVSVCIVNCVRTENSCSHFAKSIIMVGGFGASAYLRKRVDEHAKTQKDKLASNFELLCPSDS